MYKQNNKFEFQGDLFFNFETVWTHELPPTIIVLDVMCSIWNVCERGLYGLSPTEADTHITFGIPARKPGMCFNIKPTCTDVYRPIMSILINTGEVGRGDCVVSSELKFLRYDIMSSYNE